MGKTQKGIIRANRHLTPNLEKKKNKKIGKTELEKKRRIKKIGKTDSFTNMI